MSTHCQRMTQVLQATLNACALGCESVVLVQAVDVRHADVRNENAVAAAAMTWAAMTHGLIKCGLPNDNAWTTRKVNGSRGGSAPAARHCQRWILFYPSYSCTADRVLTSPPHCSRSSSICCMRCGRASHRLQPGAGSSSAWRRLSSSCAQRRWFSDIRRRLD